MQQIENEYEIMRYSETKTSFEKYKIKNTIKEIINLTKTEWKKIINDQIE